MYDNFQYEAYNSNTIIIFTKHDFLTPKVFSSLVSFVNVIIHFTRGFGKETKYQQVPYKACKEEMMAKRRRYVHSIYYF